MIRTRKQSLFQNIDWVLILIYLLLVTIGLLNIYSATYTDDSKSIIDISLNSGKQFIWIIVSIILGLFLIIIDVKFYTTFTYLFYAITLILITAVIFVGTEVSGAKSWIGYGDLGIQPSEFAKVATAMAMAKYISTQGSRMELLSTQIKTSLFFLVPTLIVILQNDTGSALVFLGFIFVMYREGMPGTLLWLGLIVVFVFIFTILFSQWHVVAIIAVVSLIFGYYIRRYKRDLLKLSLIALFLSVFSFGVDYIFDNVLQAHQKSRIEVLLGIDQDLQAAGYNVNQSKIAIGSGGFWGKGFLKGTQTKFRFVPEQSTDFIYCTIGEEWGFVGSFGVVLLFLALLIRIIINSERQRSPYSRIYGYGLASIIFVHFVVNIGMTMGLMPVIGIPLPFISYGGSSLIGFTAMLFVFIKLDMNRQNIV
ncbi:MAG: rod shape-determining protein RodA [Bacteroidales bacterium]